MSMRGENFLSNLSGQSRFGKAASSRADTSYKEQQCSGMSAYASGAVGQRTAIEVAFAPGH
jgi:hypothetical protein